MEDYASVKLNAPHFLELGGIDQLLQALRQEEYQVIGPTIRDGAIVYDQVTRSADLPAGWTDVQDGGSSGDYFVEEHVGHSNALHSSLKGQAS